MNGFAAGTLVHTEKGLVPIEQIKVGENVLSKAADGSGDLVYKPVKQTIVTENSHVSLLKLLVSVDSSLPIKERIRLRRLADSEPATHLLITDTYPVHVVEKGWISSDNVLSHDILINKDLIKYSARPGNNQFKNTALRSIYKTDKPDVGFVPMFDEDSPVLNGSLINLETGEEIKNGVSYKSFSEKLYEHDPDWKKRLLEQTPEEHRDHAEFFGFRQGEWRDPDTVDWKTGEGLVRTTVYNIEVEDTHTYFVGETGIWVHNCGGEEDCVGYRCMWRTRETRVNKTKKEKEL